MALSASTVFEINSSATAGNVNAGGFNPANANMLTDLTADANTGNTASPVVSSASYNFVAGDVGHWLYIKSGTSWTPGWYQIASVASNKATLSADVGEAIQVNNNRFGANTAAGCATTGTPTGGTWTIDYSQSTASPFASTDLASSNGTTNPSTITSATNPFGKNMVGNLIHITAGTSWGAGWYEIVSVSGSTATLDRAVGFAASLSNGTGKVGGALSLGAASDDAVFELAVSSATSATRFFIKGGSSVTYTLGTAVSVSSAGNASWPVIYEGYATARGDRPTGNTRPTLDCGVDGFLYADLTDTYCIQFTSTASLTIVPATNNKYLYCKAINTSTTADRTAFGNGTSIQLFFCEGISYRGRAFLCGPSSRSYGCYFHDSNVGIRVVTANDGGTHMNNLIVGNVTSAVEATVSGGAFINNTIYGAENKLGIGVNITAAKYPLLLNNILYGFATGVNAATNAIGWGDYNDFYNNTNDVSSSTQWQKGAHDIAVDPQFANVQQLTGTSATTSGNVLTQSGADFSSVVDGQDYLYLVSGTGITPGIYGIVSHTTTTLTLDIAPGTNATANKVWQITTGRNFAVGPNLKATGSPGVFPGGLTTGYLGIGAAQSAQGETAYTFISG